MSSKKQYKNVYTILEKVKKGEIQSYYKDSEGLFGKVKFYKKQDLIKPYLHYLDESNLHTIVSSYINRNNSSAIIDAACVNNNNKKIINNRIDEFLNKVQENYRKFPEHIEKDIYKMFYSKIENVEFEDRTDKNKMQYKFLEKANNPVAKIMTEGGSLKSSIFTKEIMLQYAIRMALLGLQSPEQEKEMQQSLSGEGDEGGKDASDIFDSMMNSNDANQQFDQGMQKATELCKTLDEILSDELQDKLFDTANKSTNSTTLSAGKLNSDYIRRVASNIMSIKMSMQNIKNILKKLLDRSISQFSARPDPIYEDLFNSDNIANLNDFLPLHPKLRKFMVEDVLIKDNKYIGKLNLYIDISGSMSDYCGIQSADHTSLSKLDFAKAFAAQMLELDMLENIYLFNTKVKRIKTDIMEISTIDADGGTRIDSTIEHVNNVTKSNSIIITDAEDTCHNYSDKVLFIGIKGAKFNYFYADCLEKYVDNQQIIIFDGVKISNIDKKGNKIK